MAQHQVEGPRLSEDLSTFDKKQAWRMRWVVLIAFLIIFLCSLVVIGVTNNPFLVSLPGSLLLFMRPIMRYLFGGSGNAQQSHPTGSGE